MAAHLHAFFFVLLSCASKRVAVPGMALALPFSEARWLCIQHCRDWCDWASVLPAHSALCYPAVYRFYRLIGLRGLRLILAARLFSGALLLNAVAALLLWHSSDEGNTAAFFGGRLQCISLPPESTICYSPPQRT
eukprot:1159411-Pelagomonas_calceolata.AAC.11